MSASLVGSEMCIRDRHAYTSTVPNDSPTDPADASSFCRGGDSGRRRGNAGRGCRMGWNGVRQREPLGL
eukprot:6275230-Alexandrium_andersonii.AAC.1